MRRSTKNFLSGLIAVLATALLVGGLAALTKGFREWNPDNWFDKQISSSEKGSEDVSIVESGISVKALKTVDNTDGTVSKIFTYTVTPENASNQSITATAKYVDGSACTTVLTVSVDTSKKEVTLKCLADFDKKIKVTLVSAADSTKTAEVTVDYVKKVKSATYNNAEIALNLGSNDSINYTEYVNVTYSKFTKDKTYNLKFKSVSLGSAEMRSEGQDDTSAFTTTIENSLKTYITTLFNNPGTVISDASIWNVSSSNSWHSLLKTCENGGQESYISYDINSLVVDVVDGSNAVQNTITISNETFTLYLGGHEWGSSFQVNVDSLAAEVGNIQF